VRQAPDDDGRGRRWLAAARAAGERLRRGLLAAHSVSKAHAHRAFQDPGAQLEFLVELALALGFLLAILRFPE